MFYFEITLDCRKVAIEVEKADGFCLNQHIVVYNPRNLALSTL